MNYYERAKYVGEAGKSHVDRHLSGFYARYMEGRGVDIGYKGQWADALPILTTATGIEPGFPGYDGVHLPYSEGELSYVYSSHLLEHVKDYKAVIKEWYRVLHLGGYIVCIVPHQWLYEKKAAKPSNWNEDHKRFYTPSSLLREFEESLPPNGYRVMHLRDNDKDFDYSIGPDKHSVGCYEIELVIQKIEQPDWCKGL